MSSQTATLSIPKPHRLSVGQCKVCKHPQRSAIESEVAAGQSNLRVATKYTNISEANIRNHLRHYKMPEIIREQTEVEFYNMLTKHAIRLEKMLDACDDWLIDPSDPSKYTIEPRAIDAQVVYLDNEDLTREGDPKTKKAPLQVLLDEIKGVKEPIAVNYLHSDNRKLFLETVTKLHDKLDILARVRGLYQAEKPNESELARAMTVIQMVLFAHQGPRCESKEDWKQLVSVMLERFKLPELRGKEGEIGEMWGE